MVISLVRSASMRVGELRRYVTEIYMRNIKYIFLTFFVSGSIYFIYFSEYMAKERCLDNGGKWASNGSFCIHSNCAEDGSCLPSYNNSLICRNLSLGITKNELYFQLGMPIKSKGEVKKFLGGGDAPLISATIKNGNLIKLNCGNEH